MLIFTSITTGCESNFQYPDNLYSDTIAGKGDRILVSDFAHKLKLKVKSTSRVAIRLADSRNSVLVFTGANGEIMVNGRTVYHAGALMDQNGDYRIDSAAVKIVEDALIRKRKQIDYAERERLRRLEKQRAKQRELERKRRQQENRKKKIRLKTRPLIVIDPGHGGVDPGAIRLFNNRNDRRAKLSSNMEKTIVLNVSKQVAKVLKAAGARVVMTRSKDRFVELDDRAAISNRLKPRLFISIHADSALTRRSWGHTVFYPRRLSSTGRSYKIGKAIDKKLRKITKGRRGVRQHTRNLRVLEKTKSSALLVELGFLSNRTESAKLVTSSYQKKLAKAIAQAIIEQIEK